MNMAPCPPVPLHARLRHFLSRGLFRYGRAVARCPWPYLVLPVLVLGELGAGLLLLKVYDVTSDDVNLPRDSQAFQDQARVRSLFPDRTGDHYDALELNEDQIMGSLIFTAPDNASIYDDDILEEIRHIIADVKARVSIQKDGLTLKYDNLCGRRHNACVVTGERLLAPQFNQMRQMGILSYPKWKLPTTGDLVDLSFALADADKELQRVGTVRVTFKLRHDQKPEVFRWEEAFVDFLKNLHTNATRLVFSASSSVSLETEARFRADLMYAWLCLALLTLSWCLIMSGGDVVSTRALLMPMGVVSPALGVLAAMGTLSYCQVEVVEMVWLVPLLVLAKGLTDMALMTTAWSAHLDREGEGVEETLGWCVVEVGGTITVTSLSLALAFGLAYTSSIPSLANFSLYAGVAVLFCYVSTMMFGTGCLAVHGHRVLRSRHTLTCRVTRSRDQLTKEGASGCRAVACAPRPIGEKYGDQGGAEKLTRWMLPKVIGSLVGKVVIGLLYLGVLAVSVFGITRMKIGIDLPDLVARSSYIGQYLHVDSTHFGFSFPVVFVLDENTHYNQTLARLLLELLDKAKQDPGMQEDFVRCWMADFLNSSFYNQTTEGEEFAGQVIHDFLLQSETFLGDVVLDDSGERVVASRCYVFTKKSTDQEELSQLMQRMRGLAAQAGFPVLAFHPAFLNYDQMLAVLPALLRTVGTALGVLGLVYLLFFPDLVTLLVTVTGAVSCLLGTVGLMGFLHVPLSFVSVLHVLLNVGFVLHFSVPLSAAYLQSASRGRAERVAEAVERAAVPVGLSALCLIGGLLVLLAASSYSFTVLLKVTLITLLMVIFHCLFFTAVILSLVGPEKSPQEAERDQSVKQDILHRQQDQARQPSGCVTTDWPTAPAAAKISVTGNGSVGHGYSNGDKPMDGVPTADYENTPQGMCPHGLTSTSFEQASKTLASSGYYNTAGQYENWSKRTGGDARDVYDIPVSVPSTHSDRREGARSSAFTEGDVGQRAARPLIRRGGVASPVVRPRSTGKAEILGGPQPSAGPENMVMTIPRPHALKPDTPELVEDVDDVFLETLDYEPVTSLEEVHHVACTLSTSGTLAGTQNYVTENFHDIPY